MELIRIERVFTLVLYNRHALPREEKKSPHESILLNIRNIGDYRNSITNKDR